MASLNPFIIDCDTGRDDALTIWLSLAFNLPLAGVVASYGNTPLKNVIDNTARVLDLAGREDIPLFGGNTNPSRPHINVEKILDPKQKLSGNGLCNLSLPEANRPLPSPSTPQELAAAIAALADKHGKLDYIITGPATNFAALCGIWGDKTEDYINSVTMMGGKFSPLWEDLPGADFNIACDPFAVQTILESGITMRFVPMNVTWPIAMAVDELEKLTAHTDIARTSKDLMIAHCRHFSPEPVFRFHDPVVVLACLSLEGFKESRLTVDCDESTDNFARLQRVPDGHKAFIYEATEETQTAFLRQVLESLSLILSQEP